MGFRVSVRIFNDKVCFKDNIRVTRTRKNPYPNPKTHKTVHGPFGSQVALLIKLFLEPINNTVVMWLCKVCLLLSHALRPI